MTDPTAAVFDPTGEMPEGISLVEASAGTGKTWNITGLVLRLVVERDVRMREILVVTYTRAATAELKDRIRRRLAQGLATAQGREDPKAGDAVMTWLRQHLETQPADAPLWTARLVRAKQDFDQCLISTIHGFCQRMLQQNAFESGAAFGLELVPDNTALIGELVDDWLSRELYPDDPALFEFHTDACGFVRGPLLALADLALRDPDMDVVPQPGSASPAAWRADLAAFERRWTGGWKRELPPAIEAAAKQGILKPRGQTYRLAPATAHADEIAPWLDEQLRAGVPMDLPGDGWWTEAGFHKHEVDPARPFQHEALAALWSLARWRTAMALDRKAAFVAWVRAEFDRRAAERGVQSYQDLVRQLARRLRADANPVARQGLVTATGGRFAAALIDEFQDTDDLQWTIFSELFSLPSQRLYLIGDPKQAIYGFRGANVQVYRTARDRASAGRSTMDVNYRTDQRLVDALNLLMDKPGFFGEEFIDYVRVRAAATLQADGLRWPQGTPAALGAPLQVRLAGVGMGLRVARGEEKTGKVGRTELERALPARVAQDVVEFLESGAEIRDAGAEAGSGDGFRPVGPGDVAVLVRTGSQGRAIRDALVEAGVPAVVSGTESVLASDEAREIELWLQALAEPGRDGPARAAATTRAFGRTASDLLALDDEEPQATQDWDRWLARLERWRALFLESGFMRAFRAAMEDEEVAPRLLRRPDGDRRLTNLLHVAELLHVAASEERLQLAGLLLWLARARAGMGAQDEDAVQLRLERDDEAVRILTVHKAKGLQFPVVFVPFAWKDRLPKAGDPAFVLPHPDDPARRVLDLRTSEPGPLDAASLQDRREALRLLYVALTRARHRCVLYTAWVGDLELSALGPALHGDPGPEDPEGGGPDRFARAESRVGKGQQEDGAIEDLGRLAALSSAGTARGGPSVAVTACDPPGDRAWTGRAAGPRTLQAREFLRPGLDRVWRRYSYTALTTGQPVTYAAPEEREAFDDDQVTEGGVAPTPDPLLPRIEVPDGAPDVPLASFPAGASAGTFLHEVLELLDFRRLDPAAGEQSGRTHLGETLDLLLPRHGFDPARWRDPLLAGLTDVVRTPLGGPLGALRLCDVPRESRLDELRFDFPIAGGGERRAGRPSRVTSDAFVAALQLRPPDEAMRRPYMAGLSSLRLGTLAGFMTGSIDVVFRARVDGRPRWFVADYKSNRLDPRGTGRHPVQSYRAEGMRWAMEQHHYYLQYHLYTLALHRYLRWRLARAGYDPADDIGGVYYLFLRGMVGPDAPRQDGHVCGCFFDRVHPDTLAAMDVLFADGATGKGGRP